MAVKTHPHGPPKSAMRPGHSLAIKSTNVVGLARTLQQGLSYQAVERLRKFSGLSLEELAAAAQIPIRTLARRKAERKLSANESERLYRLAVLIELAVTLFEGDVAAAGRWLQSPIRALADQTPLEMAQTEVGAREVENLIGRLEHGVFS